MALNHKDRSSGQKSAAIARAMMVLLPPALKHGRTGLIAKADKSSTDPLTVQSPPYPF